MTTTSFPWQALPVQYRVVRALLLREIVTRYGRHNLGSLWMFIEPMLLTLGVTVLWHYTFTGHDGALSVTAFAVTGYSCVQLWRTTTGRCLHALQPNLSLLYHRDVGVLQIFAARILLELVGASAAFALMVILFSAFELMPPPRELLPMLLGWGMLAWFGAGLALCLGAGSAMSEMVDRVWHPVSYLLFPLSGAMFLVDWLPSQVQALALWVPMINAIELVRAGYYGDAVHAHYTLAWPLAVNLCLTLFGLHLCRLAEARVENE